MTAEAIANVIADLRHDRVKPASGDDRLNGAQQDLKRYGQFWRKSQATVVDCTAIYKSLVAKDEPIYLYEDHPSIAPPFPAGNYCYVNEHGNVVVMTSLAIDHHKDDESRDLLLDDTADSLDRLRESTQPQGWEPSEPVDWERVRWTIDTFLWIGGRTHGKAVHTHGPCHLWRFAIYDDGKPADLHWVHIWPEYPMEHWDMAHLVLLGALNFLNCRNVDLVEPVRSRAQRRRLERSAPGITVHEINVFPAGKSSRGGGPSGLGVPLSSVRGHFASYGPQYDRGLLFGKYEGRFWIPQHARGSAELGEQETSYTLVTP